MVNILYRSLFVLLFLLTLWAIPAHADSSCATCGDQPRFPDAVAFLGKHGYSATDYEVLLTWSEQTRDGTGKYVSGFHVRPLQGGKAFDLYGDGADALLDEAQLAKLRIGPKGWELPPVEAAASVPEPVSKAIRTRPAAMGTLHALRPSGRVSLMPIDLQSVLQEDANRPTSGAKGPKRIAAFQNLDQSICVNGDTVTHGSWQSVPSGGWLWSASITSPEALGIRVHFATIAVPAGAQVVVYSEKNPGEASGPYVGVTPNAHDLWSATCLSESVIVECYVPSNVERSGVHLLVDRITHQYIPFSDMPWGKAVWAQDPAGSCNLDVTCHPEWASTATGIAGYNGVDGIGGFFCSGTLIADTANTGTPYFLTANHCVSTTTTASTLELFWLYQTAVCNGTPPNISSVPTTTGGGVLLVTADMSTGTDFCLLRLNTAPPSGITHVGWSSSTVALNTSIVGIHHPSGSYKRISFGVVSNANRDPALPGSRFHQTLWSSGVTEGGSSGSPLLNVATQQIIGQLYGGLSGCGELPYNQVDYYGRFDQTFLVVQTYLNPVGSLQVSINPAGAVSAGAQWRVDGGVWEDSGVTIRGVSVGQHTVDFKTIAGWSAPADQTLTVNEGQTTSTTGTYIVVPPTGSLKVSISPADAVSAGAQWRTDGGPWETSGVTLNGLSVGPFTVSFKALAGWNTPADQTVTISDGQTTLCSGAYVLQTGSLQVTISPADAVSAGAQWRVDGSVWRNSGDTTGGLPVGQHTVDFSTVTGWGPPLSQVATISDGQTTILSGTYTPVALTGSLQVTIGPATAVAAGARWRADGSAWEDAGTTVSGLPGGQHTVDFEPVKGWNTPASQQVTITNSQTTTLSALYTVYADVNGDGVTDAVDIQMVIDAALGIDPATSGLDIDGDGVVNAIDVQLVINAALGIFP